MSDLLFLQNTFSALYIFVATFIICFLIGKGSNEKDDEVTILYIILLIIWILWCLGFLKGINA